MNRQYALIGVEGNHDQVFVAKVLKELFNFQEFNGDELELEKFWKKFVPTYPPKNGKLYKRLDMPSILFNDKLSVGIYVGEGANLIKNLTLKLSDIDIDNLSVFAIVADADENSPQEVVQSYYDRLKEYFPNFPLNPGEIVNNTPRLGIYILPNNSNQGVLETLLFQCGEVAYPDYIKRANNYIDQFTEEERKKLKLKWKPFDKQKAIIATIVSVLKPGKTNTVSIKDNKWISKTTKEQVPELANFVNFLEELLK
ncbi:DUF3226 domain-containing protein [Crocosphaera sp.]|uniref:DUF3226 domain-containing protein n=1 Tax=Crocosphaera sp. TaxID=2729996 RepID=UPI0026173170|nr:DUF3226 domain-containing protein [Crocosphaera sp.]MDJ0580036.1 hypothetical protein [Crocosphaera sp.]